MDVGDAGRSSSMDPGNNYHPNETRSTQRNCTKNSNNTKTNHEVTHCTLSWATDREAFLDLINQDGCRWNLYIEMAASNAMLWNPTTGKYNASAIWIQVDEQPVLDSLLKGHARHIARLPSTTSTYDFRHGIVWKKQHVHRLWLRITSTSTVYSVMATVDDTSSIIALTHPAIRPIDEWT